MRRWLLLLWWLVAGSAWAAGPRWVAGSQWTNAGKPMGWYRADVQYFVDAGPLSAAVSHEAAVAVVDAAASVWNVANVPLTLRNGGVLAEDVSGGNVYAGANGPVWPADVQSANYAAKQIAVVLDADGSITEMLRGAGASDPGSCRQNAVTESVDLFVQPGSIAHALLVVNGRCSGAAAEQQLQLQYQLMRAFGRVLGLGWSQTNDNVFTGVPAPTYAQQMHWPVMHPMDIVCGPYTYQCMPQPFTLRDDDLAALQLVYGSWNTNLANTVGLSGRLTFANGMGMNGVNLTVTRWYTWGTYGSDPYQDVSAVTGVFARVNTGNSVTGAVVDSGGEGVATASIAGSFLFYGVPALTQFSFTNLTLNSEPLNPLYVGAYAVGPYRANAVTPSGAVSAWQYTGMPSGYRKGIATVTVPGAAGTCNTAVDGAESAPASVAAEGVWDGQMCGVGHMAWSSVAVKSGRSATLEVTAVDESWQPTKQKAMPVMGVWHASDATGTLPSLAQAASAFNVARAGMTQVKMQFAATERIRLAVGDQRGDGRPDYVYRARLLYADAVQPAQLAAGGGAVRIAGMGFRAGNTVTIGGKTATVTSVSATEIDAIAPAGSGTADVVVTDLATGGSTTITGGLSYSGSVADAVSWASSMPAAVNAGASVPLAVRVLSGSGKPSVNAAVTVSLSGANGVVNACALSACTLSTDASGVVQVAVTPQAAGQVTVQAALRSGAAVSASFTAVSVVRAVSFVRATEYVAAGAGGSFVPAVVLTTNGVPAAGQAVAWTSGSPRLVAGSSATVSGADGVGTVRVASSLRDGEAATVQACAWSTVCATQNVVGVAAASLAMTVVSGDGQSVASSASLGAVTMRVVDGAGHPVAGAAVQAYQVVTGWQPPCAVAGRCAVAPVYGKSSAAFVSDDDGLVVVTPLQYASTAAVTKITATVGTQGVATVLLQKTP